MDRAERYRAAKQKAYETLETDEGQETYFSLRLFLAVLIVLNLISVALNTVPWNVERYAVPLALFEIFSVAIITVELSTRVWGLHG